MRTAWFTLIACVFLGSGCKPKPTVDAQGRPLPKSVNSVPLPAGMSTYLADSIASNAPVGFNMVMNPGAGIAMYAPPGFEWSSPNTVLGAFSNVIKMNEGNAVLNDNPLHIFYALPDLISELRYAITLDAQIYTPTPYEQYLGGMQSSKLQWTQASSIDTPMGKVPVHERTPDGVETYSNGDAKHFKVIIRQYGLCWKSNFVVVTVVIPEPMDQRLRSSLDQAVASIRLIAKTKGDLVLPPEGPKAEQYDIKGSAARNQYNGAQPFDPLDEMNRVNELNRQNQQNRDQGTSSVPPATSQGAASGG